MLRLMVLLLCKTTVPVDIWSTWLSCTCFMLGSKYDLPNVAVGQEFVDLQDIDDTTVSYCLMSDTTDK